MLIKNTTTSVEESEERFRGIIENARDIITLVDSEGTIIYNSPAFARQLGYESWEVLGQEIFLFIHDDDRSYVERQVALLIEGAVSEGTALEFRFRHKDGRWRVFEAMVSNLLNNDLVKAVVLNSRDVTEHRQSETELEKYRYHLEDLVDRRTHELMAALEKEKTIVDQQMLFISMVSHEFRTPLTIIDGNAQIIQRRGQSLTQEMLEKRAKTIRTAVDRLVRLIETILSAHMLQSGKLTVTLSPCDLGEIVEDSCSDQMDIVLHRVIKVDIQPDMPKMMLDEKVMRQIMANLISNAVKYSPHNPLIEVRLKQEDGNAVIRVKDQGVGIPEAELPKIFTRYFRATTSGGIPGSGLGLSLVKQFVELHDGRIEIQSKAGVGTTVTVHIPIKPVESIQEGKTDE